MNTTFELIETFRLAININQLQLARRIAREAGLSEMTVYDYIRGRFANPHPKTINAVEKWRREHQKEIESAILGAVKINRRLADLFEQAAEKLAVG